ncbi:MULTISPECIES: E3 binding domain-containing protein [unclassified Halomonas]|uniref:E3 binding domain-containing protein n=1 Tax=unclassified Halomonas TaxID=2609666 RepID=UPI00207688EE|nr:MULTISPECIES: E3 binding domain-containing protein [unclassified Halomonas]UYG01483.1 E3 binding domain-containing protein [Halomonas sp. GD1P12]WNL37460.1 E3 binding domain-containing protein [Halomonas sp. PAMB 3232]
MENDTITVTGHQIHAAPCVRMLARTLGVNLAEVEPSGLKERIVEEDVKNFVRHVMDERKRKSE